MPLPSLTPLPLPRSLDSPSASLEQVTVKEQVLAAELNDSDLEAEPDLPDWAAGVPGERLQGITSRERKRQDTINGEEGAGHY